MHWGIFLISLTASTIAMGQPLGETAKYISANGVAENCIATEKVPGGDYSDKDLAKEEELCSLDFYDNEKLALCPKTWSTSPGTMIYDLSKSDWNQNSYETSKYCGKKTKPVGVKTAAKFKQTMHQRDTSSTFSKSSLLYYHLSRYFKTQVTVPPSVYREMDRSLHRERVSKAGLQKTPKSLTLLRAGWEHLLKGESSDFDYSPIDHLLTQSREQIYGILIKEKGSRYGKAFNGIRGSWGKGQNYNFQMTPAFLALRRQGSLTQAITHGIEESSKNSGLSKHLGRLSELQMASWMKDLIELTLMDYILSQQDRIGNIDFHWDWVWVEQDQIKARKEGRSDFEKLSRPQVSKIPIPEDLVPLEPELIQRTHLNDNDAGGLPQHRNYTKTTGMLEDLFHYSAELYHRLLELDDDLQNQGDIYLWLSTTFDLSQPQIQQIVVNTHKAARILKTNCKNIAFDLDKPLEILKNPPLPQPVNCP